MNRDRLQIVVTLVFGLCAIGLSVFSIVSKVRAVQRLNPDIPWNEAMFTTPILRSRGR